MASLDQPTNVPRLDSAEKSDTSASSPLSDEFVTFSAPKIKESPDVKTSADAATNSAAHLYMIGDGMPPEKADQGVSNLQAELSKLKYPVGKTDGMFGPATKNALEKFQKYNGLPQTGEADEATQAKLANAKANADPEPPSRHVSTAKACVMTAVIDDQFYCIHKGEALDVTIPGYVLRPASAPSYNRGLSQFIYNRGTGQLELESHP